DVVAGHTYFVKFIRMISSDGEYLKSTIKAGNNEIYTKTVNNTSDPNALKVQGIFKAPVGANGKLSFEFGFGNIPSEEGNRINGDTYIREITLIDLTQDMTDLYAFDLSQCDSYFFGKTFKTLLYEKSGTYVCLNNAENNANWELPSQKHIMTVSANNNNLVLSKSGIINLNYVLNSTGTKLTQGNNGITIGAGVTKVKVSCNFWVFAETQRRVWIKLNHKSAESVNAIGEVISTDMSGYVTGSISPVLVDVSQGDYFYLSYDNEVAGMSINHPSGNYHATTLTVEVIEQEN
ncbi:MAG: hypothetical protein WAP07_07960, partial [Acutalibacteraceae bacterium]